MLGRKIHLVLAACLLAVAGGGCRGPSAPDPPITVLDLSGRDVDPLAGGGENATVFLFVRTDCPISNRYAPEIRRLAGTYGPRGVRFFLVYPDPDETPDSIRRHLAEYDYPCGALRDPRHALVRLTRATVTPEAAVFRPDRTMIYRGRIDDRYVDFNQVRRVATRRDLVSALDATLAGREVAVASTPAIGCIIADIQ